MAPVLTAFVAPCAPLYSNQRLSTHRLCRQGKRTIAPRHARPQRISMDASPPASTSSVLPSTSTEVEPSSTGKFKWMENWYPVAFTDDVPDLKPLPVTIWERHYVLFRDRATGFYVVMDDICPHRAAPLSEGRLYERETDGKTETILECGYHGWRFGCDGKCVDIPVVPLENRIPSAADIGGVYPTHVSVGGLIFVWLGERSKANERDIPIPKELMDMDSNEYITFRNTFRYFPMSFTTLHENVADPAHVNWAHHGSGQGDRNKVPRHGGLEVLEERLEDGYVLAASSGNFRSEIYFEAPTAVIYRIPFPKMGGNYYLLTWTSPIGHNKSVMFTAMAISKPLRMIRLMKRFTPRWFEHTITNLILDGDSPLLQNQEAYLQNAERNGSRVAWKGEYTLASGTWDALVVKFRQFLDKYGSSMPFVTATSERQPIERISRYEINDRYENHTKHCACCAPALRNFKWGLVASLIGAGISGATALFSGILYAALAGGAMSFSALPFKLAGGGGIVLCFLLLRLAKTLNHFKGLLTYTTISSDLSHAG